MSGGGIRSATFGLGALQALQKLGLLGIFDYVSTVSGGGFTGAWWSAWLSRAERQPKDLFPEAEDIEPSRRPSTLLAAQASSKPPEETRTARDPIHHLRLFANYLTPRRGALSADTWRAVTFYVRSLVFNWLVLLPMLLVVVMAAQLYFVAWNRDVAMGFACSTPDGDDVTYQVLWTFCEETDLTHGQVVWTRVAYAAAPLVILLVAMAAVSILWLLHGTSTPWLALFGLLTLFGFAAFLAQRINGEATGTSWLSAPRLSLIAAGLVAVAHVVKLFTTPRVNGHVPHDAHRTTLAQWNSGLLMITVLLALCLAVAGFGHEIVWFFFYPKTGRVWSAVRQAGGWGAVVVAVASAVWTAYQAAPSGRAKDSAEPQSRTTQLVFLVAPYVVLGVLVLLLAYAARKIIVAVAIDLDIAEALSYGVIAGAIVQLVFAISELRRRRLPGVNYRAWSLVALAIIGSGSQVMFLWRFADESVTFTLFYVGVAEILLAVAAVVGLGWMSDPNGLSMHAFYKARLVRAYLGASNPDRRGEQVTDAVPGDDVLLRSLCGHDRGAPYHLVNTTLNLVAGRGGEPQHGLSNPEYAARGAAGARQRASRLLGSDAVRRALARAARGAVAVLPIERSAVADHGSVDVLLPDRRRPLRQHGSLSARRARLPLHRLARLRCRSRAVLRGSRRRDPPLSHRFRRRDLAGRPGVPRSRAEERPGDAARDRRQDPLSAGALGSARLPRAERCRPHRRHRVGKAGRDDGRCGRRPSVQAGESQLPASDHRIPS
jgi:hypothetical protein